jgi:hypothetical protein
MMGAGDESQTNKSEVKKCCSICDRETELLFKKTIGADVKDHYMCHLCSPIFHQATQFLSNGFLCPSEVKFHIAVAWVLFERGRLWSHMFDLDEAHQIKNAWEHFRSRVVSINPHISFTVHRDSTKKCAVCSTHKARTVALEYTVFVDQGFICEDCAKIYDLLALSFTKSYLKASKEISQAQRIETIVTCCRIQRMLMLEPQKLLNQRYSCLGMDMDFIKQQFTGVCREDQWFTLDMVQFFKKKSDEHALKARQFDDMYYEALNRQLQVVLGHEKRHVPVFEFVKDEKKCTVRMIYTGHEIRFSNKYGCLKIRFYDIFSRLVDVKKYFAPPPPNNDTPQEKDLMSVFFNWKQIQELKSY